MTTSDINTEQKQSSKAGNNTAGLTPAIDAKVTAHSSLLTKDGEDHDPTFAGEANALWDMGWKVSLTTFCRLSLTTISTAFLGHLGSNELAASALASIWTNGVQILIYGFAISICTLCGQSYGARNYELVGVWLQFGLIFLTLFSIPVMVSFYYVDHILGIVTDDTAVLSLAVTYARYLIPTVWPQAMNSALRQYLQAQKIVMPATIIAILSVGVCLISNYILIYGLGPIPALHFIGSPIAQCVASWFQPVALVLYAFWYKGYHKRTWFGFRLSEILRLDRAKLFVSMSLGMTLNLALDEWIYNSLSLLAGTFGPLYLAANSVLTNLWWLVFAVYWGFALPTQVRSANFLGANRPDLAKQTLHVGFVLGGSVAALSSCCLYLFRASVVLFFTPDPVVGGVIESTIPIFCLAAFVSALHIVLAAVVEAMSLASTMVMVTATGSWLVTLPAAYVLGLVLGMDLHGLWWGCVCGEATKFSLMALTLVRMDWEEMALLAVKQSEGEVLTEQEMMEDVELRESFLSATTPTMSGAAPVVMTVMTPRSSGLHHTESPHEAMEGSTFASRARTTSYGAA